MLDCGSALASHHLQTDPQHAIALGLKGCAWHLQDDVRQFFISLLNTALHPAHLKECTASIRYLCYRARHTATCYLTCQVDAGANEAACEAMLTISVSQQDDPDRISRILFCSASSTGLSTPERQHHGKEVGGTQVQPLAAELACCSEHAVRHLQIPVACSISCWVCVQSRSHVSACGK